MAVSVSEEVRIDNEFFKIDSKTVIWHILENPPRNLESPKFNLHGSKFVIKLEINLHGLNFSINKIGNKPVPELGCKMIGLTLTKMLFTYYSEPSNFNEGTSDFSVSDRIIMKHLNRRESFKVICTFFEVKYENPCFPADIIEMRRNMYSLSMDYKNLFLEQQHGDFTIRVKGETFLVHKFILSARSSVFSAMFQSGMREVHTNSMDIVDAEPEILKQFLMYLYCGQTENLTCSSASDLYNLGEKYNVKSLENFSEDFLEKHMCERSFCDVYRLVLTHDIKRLKATAESVFINNIDTIQSTPEWASLVTENSAACNALYLKYVSSLADDQSRPDGSGQRGLLPKKPKLELVNEETLPEI